LQYWNNKSIKRKKILALKNSYHGDTFGAMSVSERCVFTKPFDDFLFEIFQVEIPSEVEELDFIASFSELVEKHEFAAFIFEPLVQGASGMLMYPENILDQMLKICRDNDVLLIADEVFTGFGRTGKMFASDHLSNKADIFCLSKGLTGGTMPLGITTATSDIFDAFLSSDLKKTFFHGHSFTANPLVCTAALASLDLFEQTQTWENINRICEKNNSLKARLDKNPLVKTVRVKGTILALEIKTSERTNYLNEIRHFIAPYFLKRGIILRPLGNIIYLVPPYCISDADLDYICQVIESCLKEISEYEYQ
jgi:adenosylmethionine-8-amino-7-oxononanoate aminotransferase